MQEISKDNFNNSLLNLVGKRYWKEIPYCNDETILKGFVLYSCKSGAMVATFVLQSNSEGNLLFRNLESNAIYCIPFYNVNEADSFLKEIVS